MALAIKVTDKKVALGLEPLAERRKKCRLRMFHLIIEKENCPSFHELNSLINEYMRPQRPATRSQSQGLPVALVTNTKAGFNAFVNQTARDMRAGFPTHSHSE